MRWTWTARLALALMAVPVAAEPQAPGEAERLRTAKALFFDRKYAEAREAWTLILARSRGAQADTAAYWIARSSESLGEHERALSEYDRFLARRPADRTLAEEARTSRVGLAARLVKQGRASYRGTLLEGLADPSKSVRYFTAIQMAGLGGNECGRAVPVLRRIVADETDEDLVQRARLALLRCGTDALAEAPPPRKGLDEKSRWLRLRIYERAGGKPKVTVNLPMALAELLFKSLPDDMRRELFKKGYDADNFWERLTRLPPAQVLEIEGDDGERIQMWIE